jgi:YVTN family beta-propeller protein
MIATIRRERRRISSPGVSMTFLRRMQNVLCLSVITLLPGIGACNAGGPAAQQRKALPPLSTGRQIDPSLRESSAPIGHMPVNVLLSPDGKYAVTTGCGSREQLCAIDVANGRETGKVEYRGTPQNKSNGLYFGLAFGPGGKIYAAQGAAERVAVVSLNAAGVLEKEREIETGAKDFPAGLAVDGKGRLYVTHNDPTHTKAVPFGTPASVSVHDAASGKQLGRFTFEDDLGLSNFPLAVTVNADGSRLYVASQRDDAVYVLDASDPANVRRRAMLTTGSHPCGLLLNKAQSRLYVSNAHSDTVSIVDTAADKVIGTVLLRPQVARDLAGATPLGMALSHDEKFLYVALGDMNAVAVVDLLDSKGPELEGYIPTGWYPTAVAVSGKALLVTNGKGDLARVPHDFMKGSKSVASPLALYEGSLWRVAIPNKAELKTLTQTALEHARLTPKHLGKENLLQAISRQAGKIKHVIYIVKENRTYDHVLGDLPQGNGDPERCLFGREVTPNQHALAERFILLDNFYDSGEVSGDGWTWSTQAHANEYTIRNVPYQYSGRGRVFDYEGTNNEYPTGGFPAKGPDGAPLSEDPRFKDGGKPVPDVAASPGGHLWDMARKHGLTYRNYGFFCSNGVKQAGKVITPDNWPASAGLQPAGQNLSGITNIDFRRFDMNYPDSDAPTFYAKQFNDPKYLWPLKSYGAAGAPSRFSEWKREFDLMLAKDPTGASVPNLMTLRLCTDHTSGGSPGHASPRCMVADNDYSVGQLVEAVSHSPIWKSCAIVIIEDDAQNGPDHVDAHRSICFVISPWMKKAAVDHTFQNTVSAIRTIECLLNLPPMCQYDAASSVIGGWDDAPRNDAPCKAIMPSAEIMKERNKTSASPIEPISPEQPKELPSTKPASRPAANLKADRPLRSEDDLAAASLEMDFTRADRAPADLLNRVIWKTVKGVNSEPPPTPRVIAAPGQVRDDDDDD